MWKFLLISLIAKGPSTCSQPISFLLHSQSRLGRKGMLFGLRVDFSRWVTCTDQNKKMYWASFIQEASFHPLFIQVNMAVSLITAANWQIKRTLDLNTALQKQHLLKVIIQSPWISKLTYQFCSNFLFFFFLFLYIPTVFVYLWFSQVASAPSCALLCCVFHLSTLPSLWPASLCSCAQGGWAVGTRGHSALSLMEFWTGTRTD